MRAAKFLIGATAVIATALAAPAGAAVLQVNVNHSTRVTLTGVAASVIVGNPAVADVTVIDSHTVFVTGHAPGASEVTVLDAAGHTLYAREIAVIAPGQSVTVFRAGVRDEVTCAPRCEGGAAASVSAPPAPTGLAPTLIGAAVQPSSATAAVLGTPPRPY